MLDDIYRILAEGDFVPEYLPETIETFRPIIRPPIARLTLFDDGTTEGETIRLRNASTKIGRSGCEINIPHDDWISESHLEIVRLKQDKSYRWVIKDLDSDTGFWVRVRQAEIRDGTEFLVGSGQFKAELPSRRSDLDLLDFQLRLDQGSIPGMSANDSSHYPTLREVPRNQRASVSSKPIYLLGDEYWIGRDPGCDLSIPSDVFMGRKHVRIYRSNDNKWMADSGGITNGMWIRLPRIVVHKSCVFQIGEQRCRLTCQWDRYEL